MPKGSANQFPYVTYAEQAGTPSTPAAGLALMYRKTDNLWYFLDDGGTETPIDTGTGALDHNFAATVAPTATDDTPDYQVGSIWIDVTNDNAYICVDNTSTAAVWYQIGRVDGDIDHGSIGGLTDDDHPQYIKDAEFTGADTVLLGTGSGTFAELKHNFSATAAPTGTDDSSAGYAVGSIWIDVTGDKVYICYDATASSALWQEVGSGGASLTVKEADASPSVSSVDTIVVSNGTLTDDGGGQVTIDTSGGGGGGGGVGEDLYLYENFK